MRLRAYLICYAACLALNGCKAIGPIVTVCVSNTKAGGFECYDPIDKEKFFLRYEDSEKYVALSAADAQTLITYCGQKKKK